MADKYATLLRRLRPFVDKARFGATRPDNLFTLCLKASFAKAYDYAVFVQTPRAEQQAFFLVPTLRSICEDVIILGLIQTLPSRDRQTLIHSIIRHELLSKVQAQSAFFLAARPHQSVLGLTGPPEPGLQQAETDARDVWRAHGWNLTRGHMPQTRQIAERQGEHVLLALYDFLFRFTSGTVHFNPQTLLRSGWSDDPHRGFTFRATNFRTYYAAVARTYSVFLLLLYFERFRKFVKASKRDSATVAALRKELRTHDRWPEIVTFEEMNQEPPKTGILEIMARVLDGQQSGPLLSKRRQKQFLAVTKRALKPK